MKRALAFAVVALFVGIAGLAQISGTWSGKIDLLPSPPSLDSTTLELKYTIAGFELTSTSTFKAAGFTDQGFSIKGTVGPADIEASMSFLPAGEKVLKDISHEFTYEKDWFAPPLAEDVSLSYVEDKWAVEGPLYLSSSLSVSMDFAGVSLGLDIAHKTNYVATFDEICPNLIYWENYSYEVQTTSNSGSIAVTDYRRSWEPEPPVGCCYSKYFVTGQPEILLAKVTIKGTKGGEDVSTTLSGPFEVTYLDEDVLSADTTHEFAWSSEGSTPVDGITWEYGILSDDGIELGVASSTYISDYLAYLVAEEGWDPTFIIEYDPEDLMIKFLLPSYMTYTFTAEADPFKAEIILDDVCTGIQFKEATISLSDVGLCCGLTYDFEINFTKCHGFEYAKFTIDNLFDLCCGISFGATVEFGVDYKKVSITPSWEGIEGCVEVYGDLQKETTEGSVAENNKIGGWELYGWKIGCEFAECNKLTIVTALDPAWYNDNVEDVFEDDEFEYIKIETCGAGCCGGNWSLSIQTFFQASGSLFGITRTDVEASIPVMSNLSIDFSMEVPDTELSIGWTFTF